MIGTVVSTTYKFRNIILCTHFQRLPRSPVELLVEGGSAATGVDEGSTTISGVGSGVEGTRAGVGAGSTGSGVGAG